MNWVEIGPCRVICADCLDVLPTLEAGSVDAVVTSPPYNCGKDYGDSSDLIPLPEYWSFIERIIHAAGQTLKAHGFLCVNHANFIGSRHERVFVLDELRPILDRIAPFKDLIIWDKGPANGAAWGNFRTSPRIRAQHENILVHGGTKQMPPSDIDWSEWSQFTTSIWRISANVDLSVHPAQMPIEVPRRLSLLYSPHSGTILDPFMGSGTTGVACIRTGRKFIGIEKDPRYFEIACKRLRLAWEDEQNRLPFPEDKPEIQREMFT